MTAPLFHIEPAALDDLPACAKLGAAPGGAPVDELVERFASSIGSPTRCLLVARQGPDVIGYGKVSRFDPPADAAPNTAPAGWYLGGIVVAPVARRAGVGTALTEARIAWVAERAPEVWYFTDARNHASLHLHARLGFQEVTRNFEFPGVSFEGGVGVLCRAATGAPRRRLDS